jgi:hypothetical protein
MSLAPITDHSDRAKALLLSQFLKSPALRDLVGALNDEVQLVEDVSQGLCNEVFLSTAEGVQLDDIYGRLINLLRGFLTDDDDYRRILGARVKADLSNGEVETILAIAVEIFNGTVLSFLYRQHGRASYTLEWRKAAPGTDLELAELGSEILGDATASGVAYQFTEGDEPDALTLGVGPALGTGILGRLIGSSYGVDLI